MRVGAVDSKTEPGASSTYRRHHRSRTPRWLRILTFALSILLTAAVISGLVLGNSYQPIASGGIGARLAGDIVSQRINDTPPMAGQIFLPPQKAAPGTIQVSLTNTGPYPVTIVSATLNYPYQTPPAELHAEPVQDAGQATYAPMYTPGNSAPLTGAVLQPGAFITVTLPVSVSACWTNSGSYVTINSFWVKYKFAFWTRLTQISWTSPHDQSSGAIVTQEPEPASQGGVCQY